MIPCDEYGCTSLFESEDDKMAHHFFEKCSFLKTSETSYDKVRRKFARKLETGVGAATSTAKFTSLEKTKEPQPMGHALPHEVVRKMKTPKQVSFLKQLYEDGIAKRAKRVTPDAAMEKMKEARSPNGEKMFTRAERLSSDTIKTYFSTITANIQKGKYVCETLHGQQAIQEVFKKKLTVSNTTETDCLTLDDDLEEDPDADQEAFIHETEKNDVLKEMAETNGSLTLLTGDWVAFTVNDNNWQIGQVVDQSEWGATVSAMDTVTQSAAAAGTPDRLFSNPNQLNLHEVLPEQLLTIIDEPVRLKPKAKHFCLLEEDIELINAKVDQIRESVPIQLANISIQEASESESSAAEGQEINLEKKRKRETAPKFVAPKIKSPTGDAQSILSPEKKKSKPQTRESCKPPEDIPTKDERDDPDKKPRVQERKILPFFAPLKKSASAASDSQKTKADGDKSKQKKKDNKEKKRLLAYTIRQRINEDLLARIPATIDDECSDSTDEEEEIRHNSSFANIATKPFHTSCYKENEQAEWLKYQERMQQTERQRVYDEKSSVHLWNGLSDCAEGTFTSRTESKKHETTMEVCNDSEPPLELPPVWSTPAPSMQSLASIQSLDTLSNRLLKLRFPDMPMGVPTPAQSIQSLNTLEARWLDLHIPDLPKQNTIAHATPAGAQAIAVAIDADGRPQYVNTTVN